MSLSPGAKVGSYEIVVAVGQGGMGEVYRARDLRLDRMVAIKVLPDAVAADPERLARFEREAKTLAALNHTNIAQVYGLEQGALAMEFVEGEDLSQVIDRGALPIDDALTIARQIAEALGAAHDLGIVHRDLKPSNIRVRPDGTVKVLDFGLAKAIAPEAGALYTTSAPTITSPALTAMGVVLGSAAYMSPEQAKGRAVDKRADIWAFGVVLYEMIAGRRLFDGESVSEVLAAVIKSEPDWSPIPRHVQRLLRSCLEKDPKRRLRDIGDWTRQLDDASAEPSARSRAGAWFSWSSAVLGLAAAAALGVLHYRERPSENKPVQFQIPAPDGTTFDIGFSVARDGQRVAFVARDEKNVARIWIRDFDALEARPLAGTEGARNVIWKPDGQEIAFAVNNQLKKVAVSGGPVVTLLTVPSAGLMGGGFWTTKGVIVFGGTTGGSIRSVPEGGGAFTRITALDPERQDLAHGLASPLSDGVHFVYLRVSALSDRTAIFIGSLEKKPEDQPREPLFSHDSKVQFAALGPAGDRLLFVRDSVLMSRPFDTKPLALGEGTTAIAEHIGASGANSLFSASSAALVYRTGPAAGTIRRSQLTWFDVHGKSTRAVGGPANYQSLALTRDGARAAVTINPKVDSDIWIIDLDRGVPNRMTSNPTPDGGPIWSHDESRIAFNSIRNGPSDLFVKAADGRGSEESLYKSEANKSVLSWSPDGRFLLFQSSIPLRPPDIYVKELPGDHAPIPLLDSEFGESEGRFSPDGRWIAFTSNRAGRNQIYVRSFDPLSPGSPGVITPPISVDGGTAPRWRGDGKELFFHAPDGSITAVDVSIDRQIHFGNPHALFQIPGGSLWDVAADGKRFLVAMPTGDELRAPLTVVLNWAAAPGK